jgi:hypothetical protein
MNGRTIAMMTVILALNWGGFILALAYGIQRDRRREREAGRKATPSS